MSLVVLTVPVIVLLGQSLCQLDTNDGRGQ